jgi:CPA2 family monovalent cation:H+ antiporter-2
LTTAFTVSASLAQIGEFSFILAGLGVSLGLLPLEGRNLILAGALISITLNPLLFRLVDPVQEWIRKRSRLARYMERPDPLARLPQSAPAGQPSGHVVIVGYGRVGERIGNALAERDIPIVVMEENRAIVERLRGQGLAAVSGDAGDAAALVQARVADARLLVVAVPHALRARQIIEIARALHPSIGIVCRAHSDEEAAMLAKEPGAHVFMGEHELAVGMTRAALEQCEARRR